MQQGGAPANGGTQDEFQYMVKESTNGLSSFLEDSGHGGFLFTGCTRAVANVNARTNQILRCVVPQCPGLARVQQARGRWHEVSPRNAVIFGH